MRRRDLLSGIAAATGLAFTAQAAGLPWPAALLMGTAEPGDTYAVYGPVWGEIAARASGVPISYLTTEGANQNLILLDQGRIDLGMTSLGVAREAWEGHGAWTHGAKLRRFRALFPMYCSIFHGIALPGRGIGRIADLSGRQVGVGPSGDTAGTFVPEILQVLAVHPKTLVFGSYPEQTQALLAGRLDACIAAAGEPVPAFHAVAAKTQLALLGFSEAEASRLHRVVPDLLPGLMPQGAYPGQSAALTVVGMLNFAVCRPELPEGLVFAITEAVMRHRARLERVVPIAVAAWPMNATTEDDFLPFHPGAAQYLRAAGVSLPERLVQG